MYKIWIKIKNRMHTDEEECQIKYSTLLNTNKKSLALEISYLFKILPGKLYEPPLNKSNVEAKAAARAAAVNKKG